MSTPFIILLSLFGLYVLIALLKSIKVVPSKTALIAERLGKYRKTLEPGLHLLIPFIDKVRYRHTLKEKAEDVPTQDCVTLDNVRVQVDGVLYLMVVDPKKASSGITDYRFATIQLAQTSIRSVIGRLDLDRTFEVREKINAEIVKAVDEASDPWGVKVTRYEIKDISPPESILSAMEQQMRAEREKRAEIARSIGDMESRINRSIGVMEEMINKSEGEKERRINEAEGRVQEILTVAKATAAGIQKLAEAIGTQGGEDAVSLRVSESYIAELSKLAKNSTRLVLPLDLTDIGSIRDMIKNLMKE